MRRISAEDVTASYVEHGEIVAALRGHDPAAAERAMQKHLENSRGRMLIAVGR
jgi:DNA-binding FadR family transcriptional regulator